MKGYKKIYYTQNKLFNHLTAPTTLIKYTYWLVSRFESFFFLNLTVMLSVCLLYWNLNKKIDLVTVKFRCAIKSNTHTYDAVLFKWSNIMRHTILHIWSEKQAQLMSPYWYVHGIKVKSFIKTNKVLLQGLFSFFLLK